MDFQRGYGIRALVDRLVPPRLRRDPANLHTARRLVAFHLVMFLWIPVFGVLSWKLNAPLSAVIMVGGGIGVVASFATFWFTQSPWVCGNVVGFTAWALYTALATVNGGIAAPVLVWYASIPVLTLLMSGPLAALFWTVVSAVTVLFLFAADLLGFTVINELTPTARDWLVLFAVIGLLVCIYTLVWLLNSMDLRAQRTLREVNQLLEVQASTDGLTGFANRRCFDEVFELEWKRHERAQLPLSVAMIDIDAFKQFNDACGHLEGDLCLKAVADKLRDGVRRPSDFLARYGGEEFVMILPNIPATAAVRVAENIRLAVKQLQISHPNSPVGPYVTISVGVATTVPSHYGTCQELLQEADRALYQAKTQGRDRTVLADALCATSG